MFLTVTNHELNPISYVISGDQNWLFQINWKLTKITDNQVLEMQEIHLQDFSIWLKTFDYLVLHLVWKIGGRVNTANKLEALEHH